MDKNMIAFFLALTYASNEYLRSTVDSVDRRLLLYIYFEEAYVYYLTHAEDLDFSDVEL